MIRANMAEESMLSHYKIFHLFVFLLILFVQSFDLSAEDSLMLRNKLQLAQPSDYLVVSSNKTYTLMHIYGKKDHILTIEEIAIPESKRYQTQRLNWIDWIQQNAPGHTSWTMYEIDLRTGQMLRYYSFSKNGWFEIPDADNFISKLLNLRLTKVPDQTRKKIGPRPLIGPDLRSLWQPRLVINGQVIKDALFDAWRTNWPKDGSELSGKTIDLYLPQDSQRYPSYFPHWLQITGAMGKAKVRIIDSGSQLKSPKPSLSTLSS